MIVRSLIIIAGALASHCPALASDIAGDCTLSGFRLFGDVQIVESFPDLKVQIVESFPDLKVQLVKSFPDKCGKWKYVATFPDVKVQFVESFPDLKVQFVTSFPGVP
ncbi:MAG: hypothetical protein ABL957_14855 [Parvularculaceae bacterium]